MNPIVTELIKGAFTLLAVFIGSLIALKVYFRQKEYELTKQRYLEEGVDVIAAELDEVFGIISHNYARSLELCMFFRDSAEHFQISEIERGFLPIDQSKFHQIAHYRVGSLIGADLIWDIYQSAMANANSANSVIAHQVPEAIRILSKRDDSLGARQAAVENMVAELRKSHDEGFKYAMLGRELHTLGLLLEAERLNLKAIQKFRDRTDVKDLVARLQTTFGEEVHGETV